MRSKKGESERDACTATTKQTHGHANNRKREKASDCCLRLGQIGRKQNAKDNSIEFTGSCHLLSR